ncbi:MAG: SDR family oxidoreductase [Hyphomonadaceae bacterium]
MSRFENKTVVVTGAASGIGRASALLFASEGAKVFAADRSVDVHKTVEAVEAAGGEGWGIVMDAGNSSEVKALLDFAAEKGGSLDVIYANAGISGGVPSFFEQLEEQWKQILQVNLIGPMLAIQHGGPMMAKQGGGAIVCTASVAGLRSGAGSPAYSASKAGVINMVTTACQNLAGSNVRVNAICPGLIETGMTKPLFDRARERGKEAMIGQLNPLRRYGQPEEIARAALFLASSDASYINGHALVVDGGLSSSLPIVPPKPTA